MSNKFSWILDYRHLLQRHVHAHTSGSACILCVIICWKGQENNADVRLCRCAHVQMSKMNSQSKNLTTGTTPDLNRHMWQGSDLNGNQSTNVFNTAPTNIHILHVRTCARPLRILPYAGRSCPLFQYNFLA